jgi:hypothetical protein
MTIAQSRTARRKFLRPGSSLDSDYVLMGEFSIENDSTRMKRPEDLSQDVVSLARR